jgi:hypothetical protein
MTLAGPRRIARIMVFGLLLSGWQGYIRTVLLLWPPIILILLWRHTLSVPHFLLLLGCWWIVNGLLNWVSSFDYRGLLAAGYILAGDGFFLMSASASTGQFWLDAAGFLLELAGIGLVAAGSSLRRLILSRD